MEFHIKITNELRNFNDYVEVTQIAGNVTVDVYRMTLQDLMRSINSSITAGIKSETPFLPKNCVKLLTTSSGYMALIEIPKRIWKVQYDKTTMNVGFPRLLIQYVVDDNIVRSMKVVALKEKGAVSKNTTLYYFPFSNVHHSSGEVCMGFNTFPKLESLSNLETLHYLFFAAPFGEDYGAISLAKKSTKELFQSYENKDFDDEMLLPMNREIETFFNLSENE
ncbi:hypothetical protein [Bacillus alkalicellulosilyticus]|uniref:hypothetical protein n=1 Tax=Alkalihalobacterium alkalicellulosilyticum TaxID=1912214 RepID=UPI0009968E7C|nr:hypothetical protein [Bacillus alkalicellulosilyticus]